MGWLGKWRGKQHAGELRHVLRLQDCIGTSPDVYLSTALDEVEARQKLQAMLREQGSMAAVVEEALGSGLFAPSQAPATPPWVVRLPEQAMVEWDEADVLVRGRHLEKRK